MAVNERLEQLKDILIKADKPVSGSELSATLGVSRQIIVQDITRLRDMGSSILSTPRGYVLERTNEISKIFKVHHEVDETEEELNLIVDQGAMVKDVFIYHKLYGEIHAPLNIRSRKDVKAFCEGIKTGASSPLMTATNGYHYHTIVATDYDTLKSVEEELRGHSFIANLTDYEPEGV